MRNIQILTSDWTHASPWSTPTQVKWNHLENEFLFSLSYVSSFSLNQIKVRVGRNCRISLLPKIHPWSHISPGADLAADGLPHVGAALTHGAHGVISLLPVIHPGLWLVREWSRDLITGLWLVETDHMTRIFSLQWTWLHIITGVHVIKFPVKWSYWHLLERQSNNNN